MPSKLKPYVEKVGQNGEIRIPSDYLKTLGLCPGEKVELTLEDGHLLIEPKKKDAGPTSPLKQLTGILEIDDPDVERLIAKEAWYD
jgi:AbrB family looped-hinge helix DNA binding protein